jgi:hypothetical protein
LICPVPLHIYLFNYYTITFRYESITILLHNAPQYSTLKALERPYRGDKWEGDTRDRELFDQIATGAVAILSISL